MFTAIANILRRKREAAEVRRAAWLAFEARYPERKILRQWPMNPQKDKEGRWVACIVWDSRTRPPHRTWWIQKEEDPFVEISADEAATCISVPPWR